MDQDNPVPAHPAQDSAIPQNHFPDVGFSEDADTHDVVLPAKLGQ